MYTEIEPKFFLRIDGKMMKLTEILCMNLQIEKNECVDLKIEKWLKNNLFLIKL
jgi:hypothetical protein